MGFLQAVGVYIDGGDTLPRKCRRAAQPAHPGELKPFAEPLDGSPPPPHIQNPTPPRHRAAGQHQYPPTAWVPDARLSTEGQWGPWREHQAQPRRRAMRPPMSTIDRPLYPPEPDGLPLPDPGNARPKWMRASNRMDARTYFSAPPDVAVPRFPPDAGGILPRRMPVPRSRPSGEWLPAEPALGIDAPFRLHMPATAPRTPRKATMPLEPPLGGGVLWLASQLQQTHAAAVLTFPALTRRPTRQPAAQSDVVPPPQQITRFDVYQQDTQPIRRHPPVTPGGTDEPPPRGVM